MSKEDNVGSQLLSTCALKGLLCVAAHPFEYAKVLIQIGYEPIPPRLSTTIFGRPALKLPNVFQYVSHIKSVDGFSGCYRGLGVKVCGNVLNVIVAQNVAKYLNLEVESPNSDDEANEEEIEEERKKNFIRRLKGDLVIHTASIIVTQPFHVICIRMMAQFVGKETKYSGVFNSIVETYKENGIAGFFSGLIPKLVGDLLTVLLTASITYAIQKYLVKDRQFMHYASVTTMFISSSIFYPFQVVSTCMVVNNSGLVAGSPPLMPYYETWLDCWTDLSQRNQLKRGSSLLSRYYTGPKNIGTNRSIGAAGGIPKDSKYLM